MERIRKGSDLPKKKWGSPSIQQKYSQIKLPQRSSALYFVEFWLGARAWNSWRGTCYAWNFKVMITLHFHLKPQFKYELFHEFFYILHILQFVMVYWLSMRSRWLYIGQILFWDELTTIFIHCKNSFSTCLWTKTEMRSINMQKRNEANIQPPWTNTLSQ